MSKFVIVLLDLAHSFKYCISHHVGFSSGMQYDNYAKELLLFVFHDNFC